MASKSKTPEPTQPKPRCGCRFHNGIEVPLNSVIETVKTRECYQTGIEQEGNKYYRIYRFLDNNEIVKYNL